MHVITAGQLRHAIPVCKDPDAWSQYLNEATRVAGIGKEIAELAEFLAQCAHESGSFNVLEENLNYSSARLMAVWPKRFPTIGDAAPYARNPPALANRVYANRMGNGDEASGDGWRYRGRGLIMITGHDNYAAIARSMGNPTILQCPGALVLPHNAARSAAAWWVTRSELRVLAMRGDTAAVTRIINGGLTGLDERRSLRDAFLGALGAQP